MTLFLFIEGRKRFIHSIIIQRAINLIKKISAISTIIVIIITIIVIIITVTLINTGKEKKYKKLIV